MYCFHTLNQQLHNFNCINTYFLYHLVFLLSASSLSSSKRIFYYRWETTSLGVVILRYCFKIRMGNSSSCLVSYTVRWKSMLFKNFVKNHKEEEEIDETIHIIMLWEYEDIISVVVFFKAIFESIEFWPITKLWIIINRSHHYNHKGLQAEHVKRINVFRNALGKVWSF